MRFLRKTALLLLLMIISGQWTISAQNLTTPRQVFEANIEATGGMEAWSRVNTMHTNMEMVMEMDMASMVMTSETWLIKPDYLLTIMTMLDGPPGMPPGAGDNILYITPDEGWIESFEGVQHLSDLPESQVEQMRSSMNAKEEIGFLERSDSEFTLLDSKEFEGSDVYVIEVVGESTTRRLYSHESLLLVGLEANNPMGGTGIVSRISDYQVTDGVSVARSVETELGGMGTQSMTIKRLDINSDITPELLAQKVKE